MIKYHYIYYYFSFATRKTREKIMKISVCVGSSCHLKGSYDVIQTFKACIAEHNLEDVLEISASFCLGRCQAGVSAKLDEEYLEHLSPDNAKEVFETVILPKVAK